MTTKQTPSPPTTTETAETAAFLPTTTQPERVISASPAPMQEPDGTPQQTNIERTDSEADYPSVNSGWMGMWSLASAAYSSATSNAEYALEVAKRKTNEVVQHPEGLRASLVEASSRVSDFVGQTSADLATKTMMSMDRLMDALDPVESETVAFDSELFNAASSEKVKVLITSLNPAHFGAVFNSFAEVYGEDDLFVRGYAVESSVAAQVVGFETALLGAENRISSVLASNIIVDTTHLYIVAIEEFIVQLGGAWYSSAAVILFHGSTQLRYKGFAQLIPLPLGIVEKAQSLTSADYVHRATGLAVSIRELMAKWPAIGQESWEEVYTRGTIEHVASLTTALSINLKTMKKPEPEQAV